jgi:hypothetical protein
MAHHHLVARDLICGERQPAKPSADAALEALIAALLEIVPDDPEVAAALQRLRKALKEADHGRT